MTTPPIDDLLDLAGSPAHGSDGPRVSPDLVSADLARARGARRRLHRQRFSTGLVGLTAVAALGVGTATVIAGDDDRQAPPATAEQAVGGVRLVSQSFEAGPYTFGATPVGWKVENVASTNVTIVPEDGSTDPDPNVFVGKLVILFDGNPIQDGELATREGRELTYYGEGDVTTVQTKTMPGEPAGVISVQFPKDAGWEIETMLDFMASVKVGDGAQQGLG